MILDFDFSLFSQKELFFLLAKQNDAQREWLVVHHELRGGLKSLLLQHMIAPEFTAEVIESKDSEFKLSFTIQPKIFSEAQKSAWTRNAIIHAKLEMPKQFNHAGSQS